MLNIIDYANENNVIVHTIAIGTAEGGITSFGLSKIDEETLKGLAYNTQGESFKVTDKETLSESFDKCLKLTRKKVSIPLSFHSIILVIIIFIMFYALGNTRYRILP